jgi:hypothetical protein
VPGLTVLAAGPDLAYVEGAMQNQINPTNRRSPSDAGVVWGILLVFAGIFFLAVRYAPSDLGQFGWPFFVLVPGLVLLFIGATVRSVAGLLVPGTVVTVVALILAVQNTFDLWASWAYAWALVAPGAFGLGAALLGLARHDRKQTDDGMRAALVGVAMFFVFAVFFEGILHVSGLNFGAPFDIVLPVFLIAIGAALMAFRLVRPRSGGPLT